MMLFSPGQASPDSNSEVPVLLKPAFQTVLVIAVEMHLSRIQTLWFPAIIFFLSCETLNIIMEDVCHGGCLLYKGLYVHSFPLQKSACLISISDNSGVH